MKYFLFAVLIAIIPISALATDYGVSINIGQPGFYGQINLGNNYPRPQLIYSEPVLIREIRTNIWQHEPPIYLHVPQGHAHNWHQHCHRYQACNRSVYFVRENWYNDVYVPHYNSYPSRRYDSNRQHYGEHQDRHYDSHRDHDDHNYGKRRDKYKQGYGKHRDKHDKGHNGKKNRDRDHGRY